MRFASLLAAVALAVPVTLHASPPPCCTQPDHGGTADMPPLGCHYLGHMQIVDGLPPGATIEIDTDLIPLALSSIVPGGSLGGTVQKWGGDLVMNMHGTGALVAFNRVIVIHGMVAETHSAPKTPFTSPQAFLEDLVALQGQLPVGDPDFDLLRVTAGTNFAYPSPGATTLTMGIGNTWDVESFFDVFYRIDFVGHPGGTLSGRSGSTTDMRRHQLCEGATPTLPATMGRVKAIYR